VLDRDHDRDHIVESSWRSQSITKIPDRDHLLTGKLYGCKDWIGFSSVLRPHQHSIGYTEDDFYRLKDPTNSIKVLKEQI